MKFIKYGITLSRLTEEDIELVRYWRNFPQIQQYMQYREYITPEMQKKWFDSINNFNNFYYIIIYKGEKIGLINEKNIDWEKRESEGGMFIWKTEYLNTFVPILASLCLIELGFYYLNGNKGYARVLKTNYDAIKYNTNLGFVLCEGQENEENQLYVLTRQSFEEKGKKLKEIALKFSGHDITAYLILEEEDFKSGLAQFVEKKITELPFKIPYKITEKGKMYYHSF